MPLHTSTTQPKLPTFKQWLTANALPGKYEIVKFQVLAIFTPNIYPDITFCTEAFRYSFKCPDGFLETLKPQVIESNKAIIFNYDPSVDTIDLFDEDEYREQNRKIVLVKGAWEASTYGYLWRTPTSPTKSRKSKA